MPSVTLWKIIFQLLTGTLQQELQYISLRPLPSSTLTVLFTFKENVSCHFFRKEYKNTIENRAANATKNDYKTTSNFFYSHCNVQNKSQHFTKNCKRLRLDKFFKTFQYFSTFAYFLKISAKSAFGLVIVLSCRIHCDQ